MKVLVDTHIALWTLFDKEKLPHKAHAVLQDGKNEVYYSTASVWELCIKNIAHPELHMVDSEVFAKCCEAAGFSVLPVLNQHVYQLKSLTRPESAPKNNDPFDRILLSQAKAEGMAFMTHDSLIADYHEDCLLLV